MKVVSISSTGEKSVWKSFTFNHLVDTSFAGSAIRTTALFYAVGDSELLALSVLRGSVDVCVAYDGYVVAPACSIQLNLALACLDGSVDARLLVSFCFLI